MFNMSTEIEVYVHQLQGYERQSKM